MSVKLDNLFIIGSPLLALLAITVVTQPRLKTEDFLYNPHTPEWFIIGAMLLTYSHILLVFVRSHLNTSVFKRYPNRTLGIPLLMLTFIWSSSSIFGVVGVIAVYWDEWHSLMQTFGFGRIYDSKLGNNPNLGRKLDMGMAFVVGLLPHIIILTFLPESVRTQALGETLTLDASIAEKYGQYIHSLQTPLIASGIGYMLFYYWSYRKLINNGYKYSKAKLALFATTGISATIMVSFYSISDSAYYSNIYHALQYYFIVYVSEGPHLPKRLGLKKANTKSLIVGCFFFVLVVCFLLAIARAKSGGPFGFLGSFWLLTSLLHFWYDGFIWSVRKKDI